MGPHVWRRWPLNLIFVLIHCSTNIGFQHGASVAAAEKPVSVDFDSEGIASKVLFVGRTIFAPIMWAKNNVKVSQDTGPFLLQNIKNNFVDNGWKEKKKKKRHKRSYRVNQRHGYHEDNFQLSSSIPADFILVVVLGNPVNRASLFWLQHAFEKQLNLPLDNIGIFRTSYNIVELFFIKDDPPESDKFLDNLIPVKDIMNGTLLHNIQQRAPLLNVSDIHPQHPLVISHYTSIFWMESYFPYLAAAGIVAFVLLLTVMIYCCCKRRQKIIITEKEPQQKQQQQQQQIFYPTIAPNMKDPMMIQPEGSPVFVTKGCVTQVQTQTTRIKSKGLLESRRGSSASLTLDLNASPEMNRWDGGTPPKESSCLEYMLSAGNRLSRRDLRNSIKNNRALYQEFWEIPMNIPEKVHIAGSGMKNRYKTIIPNEFTRVILPDNEWDPLSSYINANYVRGYEGETRAYIATQGPMSHTIVDFWRMVWVEKSPIIVMITKLKEKNKPKCENYLPEDYKSCTFGKIEVKVDSVIVKGGYTLRHLYLKCNGEIQHVLHYWYTAWPDHKPPESPTMLLGLVKEVELHRYRGQGYRKTGPVIVHCSAGIGRTGCFIAISIGMRQLREEHSVDVLGTVCSMRLDRGGTIQTHEQYAFIHQALCEYEKELAEPVTNYNDD